MVIAELPRRLELRARYRRSILDAARALIEERGGPTFTVEELAERAGVARRTVFNHFAGLDDVVLTVCTELLGVLVDDFLAAVSDVPVGDGSAPAMFDELAAAMRTPALPKAVAALSQVVGGPAVSAARRGALSEAAFARVGGRLLAEVARRNPGADPLDGALLVSALMHGTAVLAETWVVRTGGRADAESIAAWDALMDRLLARTRSGFAPT